MAKERKDDSFVKKPIYLGGTKAFREFIYSNLKYPKKALEAKIEGIVYLRYAIDHKGKVTEVKVLKGLGHGCDKEAKRIIKLLEFQIPKGPRKLKVLFHKDAKIKFKLPKAKPTPKPQKKPTVKKGVTHLNYIYTTNKMVSQTEKTSTKSKQSYGYTINW